MKLDRNINPGGRGKYAIVLMREIPSGADGAEVHAALDTLNHHGCLDYGEAPDNEFFVLRLRDVGASIALEAYASCFRESDPEWASEVAELAMKACARNDKKQPD